MTVFIKELDYRPRDPIKKTGGKKKKKKRKQETKSNSGARKARKSSHPFSTVSPSL
jgi:hypothetical protein